MKNNIFNLFKKIAKLLSGKGFGKLLLVGALWRFFSLIILKKFRPDFVYIDGHKIYLDKNDSLSLSVYGVYEVEETKLFKDIIKEGFVVVDIGANIGYYTLLAASLVGKSGKVIAFEPDPENYELLKKNVLANGYNNVILVNKAVSCKPGVLPFFLSKTNSGDHRLYDNNNYRDYINVEAVSLDEYFGDSYKIDFIKIDVQGAEGLVFKGMQNILNSQGSLKILSEFWPNRLRACGTDIREYINSINKAGFKIYPVNKNTSLRELDYDSIVENFSDNDFQVNLMLVR